MAVEHVAPRIPEKIRLLLYFESTGWFNTSGEERTNQILPQLNEILESWKNNGSELLGTIDRDILIAGTAGNTGWHACFMYDVPNLQTITDMTHSFRSTGLDRFFRLEAIIGRPFFLLEN
jgi:hypothetical protein